MRVLTQPGLDVLTDATQTFKRGREVGRPAQLSDSLVMGPSHPPGLRQVEHLHMQKKTGLWWETYSSKVTLRNVTEFMGHFMDFM
jgi:hypothetical protein